jgi:hypothetical protein
MLNGEAGCCYSGYRLEAPRKIYFYGFPAFRGINSPSKDW